MQPSRVSDTRCLYQSDLMRTMTKPICYSHSFSLENKNVEIWPLSQSMLVGEMVS